MAFKKKNSNLSLFDTASEESLELLEWQRVCEQLASFASTSPGRRKCNSGLIPKEFETSCSYLAETIEMSEIDEEIEGGLSFLGVNDIEHILNRCLKGGVASGLELLEIAETLKASRRLRSQIVQTEIRPIISRLVADMKTLPELKRLIEFGLEEGGRVADRASEKLTNLRNNLFHLRIERRELIKEIMNRYSTILQDNIIAERFGRPVLAVKANAVDQFKGTVHDSSASGNTIFIEPQSIILLGDQISVLQGKILLEEKRLLAQWSSEVGSNFSELTLLCQILMKLDFALARARYGKWLGGVAPQIHKESETKFLLEEFRHPLLVWQEHYEGGNKVVPVSLDVSSELRVVAITGPNTGGKTVTLKSIGLAALMAKLGLFLPCIGKPSLPWFNQILADIGDEQSLQQSLSTFSGHIIRIDRILKSLTNQSGPSLVLLDELGAGTDPTEGTALAMALLSTLADRTRLTIATTHFGELKSLKYSDSRFENASVGFCSETMSPTYFLHWGIPGRSNALVIARRLGLEQAVIESAQNLISSHGIENINHVIQGLEDQRKKQQEAAEDAAALLARTELLHEELLSQWEQQRKLSQDFQEQRRKQLETSILEGQKEVRELIRRLRDGSADGEMARVAGQRLKKLEARNRERKTNNKKTRWFPKVGDRVRVISLGKSGEVKKVSDDGMQLIVMCGMFRSTVDLNSVESLEGQKPTHPKSVINIKTSISLGSSSIVRTKKNTIDVRGLRVHEAESVVEEKLRNTISPLWIVHGIGSGRLKKGLLDWLESLDYVDKIRAADLQDGGAGCSVVWLK